jgi:hypothetical protein
MSRKGTGWSPVAEDLIRELLESEHLVERHGSFHVADANIRVNHLSNLDLHLSTSVSSWRLSGV